jgi:hypothetical protein
MGARLLVPVADLAGQGQCLAVLGTCLSHVACRTQDLTEVVQRFGLAGAVPDPPVQQQCPAQVTGRFGEPAAAGVNRRKVGQCVRSPACRTAARLASRWTAASASCCGR